MKERFQQFGGKWSQTEVFIISNRKMKLHLECMEMICIRKKKSIYPWQNSKEALDLESVGTAQKPGRLGMGAGGKDWCSFCPWNNCILRLLPTCLFTIHSLFSIAKLLSAGSLTHSAKENDKHTHTHTLTSFLNQQKRNARAEQRLVGYALGFKASPLWHLGVPQKIPKLKPGTLHIYERCSKTC